MITVKCASIYYGAYSNKDSKTIKHWIKVVLHVKGLGFNLVPVTFWTDDFSHPELITLAKSDKATKINDGGYSVMGEDLPDEDMRNAYSDFGRIKQGAYTESGVTFIKVDRQGKAVEFKNHKPIVTDRITFTYWEGEFIDEGSALSKESRLRETMKEWLSVDKVVLDTTDNSEKKDSPKEDER